METEAKIEEIRRFDLKTEIKALKALDSLIEIDDGISEEEAVKTEFAVATKCMVCVIKPKSEEAKRLLAKFKGSDCPPIDQLSYAPEGQIAESLYPTEYLEKALKVLKAIDGQTIKIKMKKDYPITLENEHMIIVIAPRVEDC
jgi:hypothetical protein